MKRITIGKLRGIQQISSDRGVFTALALDHRQNLRRINPAFVDNYLLSEFKLDIIEALASQSTAVLLDPEVSAAQSIARGSLPGNVGLVVALESTGYTGDATARETQVIPGWSVEKAKRMGASAIKLLVYYHPDSPSALHIEQFVTMIAEECSRYDLALMLEPLSYSLRENTRLTSREKRFVVVESARRLTQLGIDVLKAEFPSVMDEDDEKNWVSACEEISAVSNTPWILLSAAVSFENYLRQVEIACKAGASGIAVGRAVWQEAVSLIGDERKDFLSATAKKRISKLADLCADLAKPYTDFYEASSPFDWYKEY